MSVVRQPPFDPRVVCNQLLDEAGGEYELTNLILQKLLYFAHGFHLVETGKGLVSGYFEAWKYGPVHPVAYRAFSSAGANPLRLRASGEDPLTGSRTPLPAIQDLAIRQRIRRVVHLYGGLSAGRLVEISHAPKAPWAYTVNTARTSLAFGLRIGDDVILERFRYHKVPVSREPASGEPSEDAPFAAD